MRRRTFLQLTALLSAPGPLAAEPLAPGAPPRHADTRPAAAPPTAAPPLTPFVADIGRGSHLAAVDPLAAIGPWSPLR